MGVLKRDMLGSVELPARGGTVGVRVPDLVQRSEEAHAALAAEGERARQAAEQERARIIEGAQAEGHEQGRAAGFAAGHAEGLEAGRAEAERAHAERLGQIAGAWEAALTVFEGERGRITSSAREDLLRLALALGERITRRSISLETDAAVSLLDAALAEVRDASRLTVRVGARDAPAIGRRLSELAGRIGDGEHAHLIVDEGFGPGDVVVESAAGAVVDARVSTQLQRVAEALLPGEPVDFASPEEAEPEEAGPRLAGDTVEGIELGEDDDPQAEAA